MLLPITIFSGRSATMPPLPNLNIYGFSCIFFFIFFLTALGGNPSYSGAVAAPCSPGAGEDGGAARQNGAFHPKNRLGGNQLCSCSPPAHRMITPKWIPKAKSSQGSSSSVSALSLITHPGHNIFSVGFACAGQGQGDQLGSGQARGLCWWAHFPVIKR